MKRIYFLLIIILCGLPVSVEAQSPVNRTTETIIADVLAQTPARNKAQFENQQTDLLSMGEDGIVRLIEMLTPASENSVKVEYALSGMTAYVSQKGKADALRTLVNAYLKALDEISDNNAKTFIIRQLSIIGKDESVEKLATCLSDKSLIDPAATALVAIHTPASGQALLKALETATGDKSKEILVQAIAAAQIPEAEATLLTLLKTGNSGLRPLILAALGNSASPKALPALAQAAADVNYTQEKTGAVSAYLALIRRLLSQGDRDEAVRAASDLMKKAEKAKQLQVREAALQILFAANPAGASGLLQKALKDKNRDYRNAALNYALAVADASLLRRLADNLKKASPELKTDILNALAQLYDDPQRKELIDMKQYIPVFTGLLTDKNPDVQQAAAFLLAKTGGNEAIAALAKLLGTDDAGIDLAKNALSVTHGDIASAVVPYLSSTGDKGKIAILQLLSDRKADKQGKYVFEQLKATSPDVQKAAYAALKNIVVFNDLAALYSLLEAENNRENIPSIQQAIIAVLKPLSKEEQSGTVFDRIKKTPKQRLYYRILAETGVDEARNFIVERFKKGDANDKPDAFLALLSCPGIVETANELLAVCKDAANAPYFDRALDGYIDRVSSPELTGENRRIFLANAMEMAKIDAQKNKILKQLGQTGSYLGLLLAGEYLDNSAVQQEAANAVMKIALNNKHFTGENVRKLLERTANVLDNPDAGYQREAIRKHLDEMPQEKGFIAVFNGKDLSGWKGLVENPISRAKMKPKELAQKQATADEEARKHWIPADGVLTFDGKGGDNLCTTHSYGDFEMYVDWKLEPSPDADAGIYLRGAPQVQIWNTARTGVGAQVGSGGLYNNAVHPKDPLEKADNLLGEWNTFYIKMIGDRVTVLLNGRLVVDNVIMENYWDRSQPIFPAEQIELQAHGSKVYYRNIYIKELDRPQPYQLTPEEKKEGYRILFDGTNMYQWTGNTVDYILEDGCISVHPRQSYGGNLYTKEAFQDFVFRFEFQLTPGANNGLGIRTPMEGDAAYVGMELQILDNEASIYKNLEPYQYHGSVYGIIPAQRGYLKPVGEWNYQEVTARGDHIRVVLNGTVILDGNIREAVKNGTPDGKEHPGLFNKKGHIGFLGHGSPLKFRNIRIKEL
ncbi:MAG: DUF1080 domain-containing protein [Dysgonamonadaceae bacterium]|jgi:HEAT repeat protein|nr:DUF1080 domain-containing protein [Dysgonamonadaceae bacterium]